MLYFMFWIGCGIVSAMMAKDKGRSVGGGMALGLLLGPIGVIIVALLSADPATQARAQVAKGALRPCPHCAELIKPEATICRYCHQPITATSSVAQIKPNGQGGYKCSACESLVQRDAATCPRCQKRLYLSASAHLD